MSKNVRVEVQLHIRYPSSGYQIVFSKAADAKHAMTFNHAYWSTAAKLTGGQLYGNTVMSWHT